jgi:proteic killer suppression protein
MIQSFRHKGLKHLYEDDDPRGVLVEHLTKLRKILARLDASSSAEDMNLPGFNLHLLKGKLRGFMAVTVRANWRVVFRFAEGNAYDLDYLDYHQGGFPCR